MAEYYLERLNEKNSNQWDEFNNNSPEGSFFHGMKWKKIADKTINFTAHYYLLFKNNSVFGIFPFAEQKIRFFRGLIPAHNLCPIFHGYDDSSAIQNVISGIQKNSGQSSKVSFIRFSTSHKEMMGNINKYPGFPNAETGDLILDLIEYPPEKIWDNFSAKKGQRKFIRRFDENGFEVNEINSDDDLRQFYQYYRENIIFIGGKYESFTHFTDIRDSLTSNEYRITLLRKDTVVAGGVLMFPYRPLKTVYLEYLSLNRGLPNTYHPTYYLFWEAINWAWDNGYEKISFGNQHFNENNPRFRIKNEFGGKFKPIYSRTISISKIFTVAIKANNIFNR